MGDEELSGIYLTHNVPSRWALFLEVSNTDIQVSNVKHNFVSKPNELQ